jgi:hypothetical protein
MTRTQPSAISVPVTDDSDTALDAFQVDDEILAYTVSDETLEAAAGREWPPSFSSFCPPGC